MICIRCFWGSLCLLNVAGRVKLRVRKLNNGAYKVRGDGYLQELIESLLTIPLLYLNVKLEHALSHLRCLVTKGDVPFVLKHVRHNCQSCIWSAERGCEVKVLDAQSLVASKLQRREGKILICKRFEQMPSATGFSDTISTPVPFLKMKI